MTSRHQAAGRTIQNSPEILHLLDVIIGRTARRTNDVEDFLTKAAKDVRMLAEEVNRDGQGTCGLLEFSTTSFDRKSTPVLTVSRPAIMMFRISS